MTERPGKHRQTASRGHSRNKKRSANRLRRQRAHEATTKPPADDRRTHMASLSPHLFHSPSLHPPCPDTTTIATTTATATAKGLRQRRPSPFPPTSPVRSSPSRPPPPPTLNSDMTWLPPRPPAPPPPKPTLAPSIPSQRTKSANASRNSLIVSSVRSREPRGIVATAIGVGTHQGSSPSRLGAASRRALSKQAHADGVCCTYPPPSHHAAWPAPRAHATVSVEGTRTAVTLQPTRCRTPRRSKYTRREGAHQREPGGTKDVERRAATSTQPPGQQRNHFQPFVARERSRGQGAEQRAAETGK